MSIEHKIQELLDKRVEAKKKAVAKSVLNHSMQKEN